MLTGLVGRNGEEPRGAQNTWPSTHTAGTIIPIQTAVPAKPKTQLCAFERDLEGHTDVLPLSNQGWHQSHGSTSHREGPARGLMRGSGVELRNVHLHRRQGTLLGQGPHLNLHLVLPATALVGSQEVPRFLKHKQLRATGKKYFCLLGAGSGSKSTWDLLSESTFLVICLCPGVGLTSLSLGAEPPCLHCPYATGVPLPHSPHACVHSR